MHNAGESLWTECVWGGGRVRNFHSRLPPLQEKDCDVSCVQGFGYWIDKSARKVIKTATLRLY